MDLSLNQVILALALFIIPFLKGLHDCQTYFNDNNDTLSCHAYIPSVLEALRNECPVVGMMTVVMSFMVIVFIGLCLELMRHIILQMKLLIWS